MSTARLIASMFGLAFLFSLTGCVMSNTPMKAPQTSSAIEVPSATSTEALFSCAETTVQALADTDDRWDPRVTLRDVEAGVLETSNYGKENESGFRIRLRFVSGSGQAQVGLKGAGAYFIDLGVEEAMTRFKSKMSVCLSSR